MHYYPNQYYNQPFLLFDWLYYTISGTLEQVFSHIFCNSSRHLKRWENSCYILLNGLNRSSPISTTFSLSGWNSCFSSPGLLFAFFLQFIRIPSFFGYLNAKKNAHSRDHLQICEWAVSFNNLYRVVIQWIFAKKVLILTILNANHTGENSIVAIIS